MNVQELINILNDLDPEMPASVVFQENYPLSANISSVGIIEEGEKKGVYLLGFSNENYAPREFDNQIN